MVGLKMCPRCRGDLSLADDLSGAYLTCLQCGFVLDVERGIDPFRFGAAGVADIVRRRATAEQSTG